MTSEVFNTDCLEYMRTLPDKAFEPSAMPDSFEVVGVNNSCDMLEYDHTRLVLAAFVCHLTGFEQIDNALGGVYEMTMNKKK